jgi:hypothetical protein
VRWAFGDVDGDGDPDLVSASPVPLDDGGALIVQENLSDEGRLEVRQWDILSGGTMQSIRAVADVDGDGRADVIGSGVDQPALGAGLTILRSGACPTPCPGDLDADGTTDFDDVLAMLADTGRVGTPPLFAGSDLDRDGVVGIEDLLILLEGWGACTER